jgi:hypothetical protein
MITALPVLLLGLFAPLAPVPEASACTSICVCARSPTTLQEEVDKTHAVFEGISVEERWSREEGSLYADFTFVVEHRWRGAIRDTVTVRSAMRGSCTVRFPAGGRFLVFAHSSASGLRVHGCSFWLGSDRIPEARRSIERPNWSAKPMGERPLDDWIRATLEQPHSQQPGVRLLGTVITSKRQPLPGVRLEVLGTDLQATSDSAGRFQLPDMQPGWYRIRMWLPSGHVEDQYTRIRCTPQSLGEDAPCDSLFRDFIPSRSHDAEVELPRAIEEALLRAS